MRYTLAKHSDINRVHFGNNLWHKAILPSIAHASGVWFNNTMKSTNELISAQYRLAKAVLKVNSMPSKTATIGELGWLPIIDHLNKSRISFYSYILHMKDERLPKMIYNEMSKVDTSNKPMPFNYVENIRSMLVNKGLDFMFNDQNNLSVQKYKDFAISTYKEDFFNIINSRPSLIHYKMVKENTFASKYLDCKSCTFKGIQIKFKIRMGVSGLGEDLRRQQRDTGMCKYCGKYESVKHFIFNCDAYNVPRSKMYNGIQMICNPKDFNMFIQDTTFAMYCLLGDHDDVFNRYFLPFLEQSWKIRSSFNV
jgi:hypothetical protein